jgi:cation:H+ antiporter
MGFYFYKENSMENFINQSPMFLVALLLVAGFALLIKGADFFVEGSSSVAKRFSVPSVIIGLTVVAMGTSLPETAVSVTASVTNNNALAVSNAVGSNIFNLMVVIGVCTLLTVVDVGEDTIKSDIPFSAFCALLLMLLGICGIGDASGMILGRLDGILMLVIFVIYLLLLVRRTLKAQAQDRDLEGETDEDIRLLSMPVSLIYIIGGGAAIALGGSLTVDTASRIATELGMSQTLIGLTIVSIGTSLPELVTSVVAARKGEIGMALGNAIGSNVFNFLMVLGIASAISPISFIRENVIDILVLLVFTVVVWLLAKKGTMKRKDGIILLVLYAIYAVYIFLR